MPMLAQHALRIGALALIVSVAFAIMACSERSDATTPERVEGFGIRVDLPEGWWGRIYTQTPPPDDVRSSVLQLATAPIPEGDDDVGSETQQQLGESGTLIVLMESPEKPWFSDPAHGFELLEGPLVVRPSDFQPSWQSVRPQHAAFIRRFKTRNGRYFLAMVVFGETTTAPAQEFARANALLQSIRIGDPP